MAELLVEIVEGPEAGRKVELGGAWEVGRGAGLGLALEGDGQVSRRHARIEPAADGALLTDLGSRNGTYVNDQPVHGPRQVTPGDRIRIGLTVLELRSAHQVAERPSAVIPGPQVTQVGANVLQPASADELPGSAKFEAPPPFAPGGGAGEEPPADDAYAALAALVDTRVKRRTNIAVFAILATAGLAVLIYLGAS